MTCTPPEDFTVESEQHIEALRRVVEYLEPAERIDYEESEPEMQANHIYNDVALLRDLVAQGN